MAYVASLGGRRVTVKAVRGRLKPVTSSPKERTNAHTSF